MQGIGERYDFTNAMRQATDHHCKGALDQTRVENDLPRLGQRYLQTTSWRLSEQRFFTDKLPRNCLDIGSLPQRCRRPRSCA
jgi:hypothetical protein